MPATYEPISTTTLSSAQSSITFSSISGSYTDLVLVINGQLTTADVPIMRVNSDTATNYSVTQLYGNGTSAASGRQANFGSAVICCLNTNCSANEQFTILVNLQNYSNATTYKTFLSRFAQASLQTEATVSMWRNTNAITAIQILLYAGNTYKSGSTFTLYGIKAA